MQRKANDLTAEVSEFLVNPVIAGLDEGWRKKIHEGPRLSPTSMVELRWLARLEDIMPRPKLKDGQGSSRRGCDDEKPAGEPKRLGSEKAPGGSRTKPYTGGIMLRGNALHKSGLGSRPPLCRQCWPFGLCAFCTTSHPPQCYGPGSSPHLSPHVTFRFARKSGG